jgi:hypothetical protein
MQVFFFIITLLSRDEGNGGKSEGDGKDSHNVGEVYVLISVSVVGEQKDEEK